MLKMNYKQKINEYYSGYLDGATESDILSRPGIVESSLIVGWTTRESQFARFSALNRIGISNESSVLDFGCGVGHYLDYINESNIKLDNYLGLDINDLYISLAKKRHPFYRFENRSLRNIKENFDFCIASGAFTILTNFGYIVESVRIMHNIANKGVAFNLLNEDYVKIMGINSFNPDFILKRFESFYRKCELINDYLPGEDFTILIHK
jgi:SAM-dependent methyltransferase